MSEHERETSRSLLEAAEARIRQTETFTWAVPALALTAQALLVTVALGSSVTSAGRAFASGTGVVTLLAALHLLGKHTFNFELYEAVIDRERVRLGLPRVSKGALLKELDSLPSDTGLRGRDWMASDLGQKPPLRQGSLKRRRRWEWVRLRRRLVVDLRAVHVWAYSLGLMAVMDLGVFIYSLVDVLRTAVA